MSDPDKQLIEATAALKAAGHRIPDEWDYDDMNERMNDPRLNVADANRCLRSIRIMLDGELFFPIFQMVGNISV